MPCEGEQPGVGSPVEPGRKPERIRFRALVVGVPLIALAGLWIFGGEMGGQVQRYAFATWAAPFYNAIYILLVLSLLNLPLGRYASSVSLNRLELLAIYVMVSVGSAMISSDLQGILVTLMGYSTYFGDEFNKWGTLFDGALPTWLTVNDRAALTGFYNGNSTFWTPQHYMAWLGPALMWTLFIWALLFMMLCVNTILRKAWVERERLTFPIVALPMAMTEEPEAFFRNRLMWIGFAAAGGLTLLSGLAYIYPSIPSVPIKRVDYRIAESGLFAPLGNIRVAFYFFAISLGYLMPLDLSFSLYLFYILFKLEAVFVNLAGVPPESQFPYYASQAFGAYMAIFGAAVWGLRRHLRGVWEVAIGIRDPSEDVNEPMRYRSAVIGFGLCSFFLLAFSIAAGMAPVVALAFFVIYLALSVMITRIRAEFGFPVHDMHNMGPDQAMARVVGSGVFDRQTLGAFWLFYWFNRVYRSHPMPHQLEGMKAAGHDGRAQRSMFRAILIAGLVAVPVCFVVYLHGYYAWGASTAHINYWGVGYGRETFGKLERFLRSPQLPNTGEGMGTLFGFGFALALSALRRRFVGFPFHPLAYAVANSWGMANLWLPIMIGSICKAVTLRGFGLQGYRKAIMFFFGLMLGEFAVGCSWTLYGLARGIPTYDFWP